MSCRVFWGCLFVATALSGLLGNGLRAEDKVTDEEIARAKKVVEEATAKARQAPTIQVINEASLAKSFPNHLFFSVVFRQFPIAVAPPEPFNSANVYAVARTKEGKSELLSDPKSLEGFFKAQLKPCTTEDQAKDAVRSWLHLSPTLLQDGFYAFTLMDDSTKAAKDKTIKAGGKVVVMKGGNGEITATLDFDDNGKLTKVAEVVNIKPGPRPICQATKLLDADPIVRKMAEQDLLFMGLAARDYLMEQRARATPDLQQAIDRLWKRISDSGW